MDNRDYILISWPARGIEGTIFPIISDLSHKFKIIVFVLNISASKHLVAQLDSLKKQKVIVKYLITPQKMKGFSYHLYLRKTTNLLKNYNIKIWLCVADMQTAEKYISNIVLNKDSKTICLFPYITYLFMYNQAVAKKLIDKNDVKYNAYSELKKPESFILKKLITSFKKGLIKSLINYILFKKKIIFRYLFVVLSKNINLIFNQYFYSFLFTGKFHKITKLEKCTQLSNGNANAYIFFDKFEVEVHKKLYKNNNIYLSYITINSQKLLPENKILGILSGWETDNFLTKDNLDMYVNDFIKICEIYKTNVINLRPHPDMHPQKNYSSQIADVLISHGLECHILTCNIPVIDQSLSYCCIAGFASAALRDVRLFNHSIDVIGFEALSNGYFNDPKFAFGSSEGIDWLDTSGNLVKSESLKLKERLSVSEVIMKVYEE